MKAFNFFKIYENIKLAMLTKILKLYTIKGQNLKNIVLYYLCHIKCSAQQGVAVFVTCSEWLC